MGIFRLKHRSVAAKVRLLITLTTGSALLLALLLFILFELQVSKYALEDRVSALSRMVATHVTAAVSFDDRSTAQSLLNSLQQEAQIVRAQIYSAEKKLLVEYSLRENQPPVTMAMLAELELLQDQGLYDTDYLHLARITIQGEVIGYLYTQTSLSELKQRALFYLVVSLLIFCLLTAITYYLSDRLHQRISEPIATLLQGMLTISKTQQYSLRIPDTEHDELGSIIKGFNKMIDRIEKQSEEVRQHAFFDSLTGLANRRMLMQRLEHEIQRCQRNNSCGAVLYLDLDRFKNINDSLGHSTGDYLLVSVAERIRSNIRSVDMAARVGGDEFVIILTDLEDKNSAARIAMRIAEELRELICQPHEVESRTLRTSTSIGITLFDKDNDQINDIIKQADLAMYQSKDDGRNMLQFFASEMQAFAELRLEIEQDLHLTLEHNPERFEIHYQPQMDTGGKLVAAEALMRWQHPDKGYISPVQFIPVAEATGLIYPLGKLLLQRVCQQLQVWHAQGLKILVAINVSPHEFLNEDFVKRVETTVAASGIDPCWIELEITEGVLLRDIEKATQVMAHLKQQGFKFSIDDFGTGYSSLQYLKLLPISKLKIDRSFVRDISTDPNDASIVTTIIAMSKSLGLQVIAEGVETREQLDFLSENGCELIQGYFYSKPLPVTEFTERYSGIGVTEGE